MSVRFNRFSQPTLLDLPESTSSAGLQDGITPSTLPAGEIGPYGRDPRPVSPSRVRGAVLGAPIRATFGRRGFSSSASAALTSSLVNRLKARLDMDGSILFAMTWSRKATPSGRWVYRVRVSARSTSGSGYGSWPSPKAQEDGRTLEQYAAGRLRGYETRKGKTAGGPAALQGTLSIAVQLAGWPRAEDSEQTGAHRGYADTLTSASRLASWATPAGRDWKDTPGMATIATNPDGTTRERLDQLPRQAHLSGPMPSGSPAATGKRGQLNPAFSRWLMGFREAWDVAAIRAHRSIKARKVNIRPSEIPTPRRKRGSGA